MTNSQIREELFSLADSAYRDFSAALIPDVRNMIGVRLPQLRALAKKIAKGDWRSYLKEAQDAFFEEILLQGMVIGCIKGEPEELFPYIDAFLPKIDNWSACDSFCAGLKIARRHPAEFFAFLQRHLRSEREFELRFCVVMLLDHYVNSEYLEEIFKILDNIPLAGYYIQMAAAWAVSVCYVKFPQETRRYLENNRLNSATRSKALQKIIESRRISERERTELRKQKERLISL